MYVISKSHKSANWSFFETLSCLLVSQQLLSENVYTYINQFEYIRLRSIVNNPVTNYVCTVWNIICCIDWLSHVRLSLQADLEQRELVRQRPLGYTDILDMKDSRDEASVARNAHKQRFLERKSVADGWLKYILASSIVGCITRLEIFLNYNS